MMKLTPQALNNALRMSLYALATPGIEEFADKVFNHYDRYHRVVFNDPRQLERHKRITEKGKLERALRDRVAPDGLVYVDESGMDCDGVRYWGRLHKIKPTLQEFYNLQYGIGEWADGPFHLHIVEPDELDEIEYGTRDLAMEAFENGHPHVLRG